MKEKIVLIGAGSASFTRGLVTDLVLRGGEHALALVDTDPQALEVAEKLTRKIIMYEGFGLPVIEAMACGSPVITSNSSSLPEAGGDAALLVNALDSAELAAAMERLIDDETLRQEMIVKGRAHAARFSYANAAKEHLALYRELLA